ncbi:hypothetical protein PUNSTDRAFT_138692 [Punctularia strigosozonata HHB-11173 SS5]|uniref:Uncharacterized protein n=1 Tax=Punctularia strigosozonata (strain HHB-11173) TaxID=741275 RepID=R7S3D3_PUNST|nr:uncharacterized protein PUNSTDRAFT_138692 [Punctularia strigosozonata HHB-11173 SS5]EIN04297.1 hypothetical protein PUNSTDRAFT_138692 [Punctularia strigosozonata HHB-11173 SS5]
MHFPRMLGGLHRLTRLTLTDMTLGKHPTALDPAEGVGGVEAEGHGVEGRGKRSARDWAIYSIERYRGDLGRHARVPFAPHDSFEVSSEDSRKVFGRRAPRRSAQADYLPTLATHGTRGMGVRATLVARFRPGWKRLKTLSLDTWVVPRDAQLEDMAWVVDTMSNANLVRTERGTGGAVQAAFPESFFRGGL